MIILEICQLFRSPTPNLIKKILFVLFFFYHWASDIWLRIIFYVSPNYLQLSPWQTSQLCEGHSIGRLPKSGWLLGLSNGARSWLLVDVGGSSSVWAVHRVDSHVCDTEESWMSVSSREKRPVRNILLRFVFQAPALSSCLGLPKWWTITRKII